MSSVIRDLYNASIDLASEDFALSEGLRRALEIFMAQETEQPKPPSSAEIWEYLSNQYGSQFNPPLREDYLRTRRSLPEDITPAYPLPCSLHASSTLTAWKWMDVLGDKGNPRVKKLQLLRPYLLPLIALFRGREINIPKDPMLEPIVGKIEHEGFKLIGGALFLFVELTLNLPEAEHANYVAHLFLLILSAVRTNAEYDLKDLKIYGLLSDFTNFKFFTYNPETKTFSNNSTMWVGPTREQVCMAMVGVANKIFGVLLTGYIASLEVMTETSLARAKNSDYSPNSSSSFVVASRFENNGSRMSTEGWEAALHFAKLCRSTFNEEVNTLEEIEARGIKALGMLDKSTSQIPLRTSISGNIDDVPGTHDER